MRQLTREAFRSLTLLWLAMTATMFFVGCSGGVTENDRIAQVVGSARKKVVPVKGKITVNGNTERGVVMTLHTADGSQKIPISDTFTNDKGEFSFTTYMKGDGLEPGEYRVTFEWLKIVKKGGVDFQGPDKLKGKYSNPAKTETKLIVEAGRPKTDVLYELAVK